MSDEHITDEQIFTEAARHLGEMHVENCGLSDIKSFARAILALRPAAQPAPVAGVAGAPDRLFSPMWFAPLDGTRVLLHLPTTNDGFAVCRWTDGHGTGWLDDEDRFICHVPHSFMSLNHLGEYTLLGKAYETDTTPQPVAVPDRVPAEPADVLGPLEKRNIFDAIRCAYDLGYNDARNARAVPGDSAPGYDGRSVETDHGGALFNTMNRRLSEAHHGITTPKADK